MKKLFKLILIVTSLSISKYGFAACTSGIQILMSTNIGKIQLSGDIKKNTLLATITGFTNMYGNTNTLSCTDNSNVWLKIKRRLTGSPPKAYTGGILNAYYLSLGAVPTSPTYNKQNDYVYTVELEDGTPFTATGTQYGFSKTDNFNPKIIMKIYAGQDNPTENWYFMAEESSLFAHIDTDPTAFNNPGRVYTMSGTIDAPKALCTLDNASKNMTMILPSRPTFVFSKIGATSGEVIQDISLTCTANATATMKLTNTNLVSDGSNNSVIIPDANMANKAEGIGFVLSYDNKRINADTAIDVGTQISSGKITVPIKAEYFRYGPEVKAGNLEAYANLQITFQ